MRGERGLEKYGLLARLGSYIHVHCYTYLICSHVFFFHNGMITPADFRYNHQLLLSALVSCHISPQVYLLHVHVPLFSFFLHFFHFSTADGHRGIPSFYALNCARYRATRPCGHNAVYHRKLGPRTIRLN